MSKRHIKLPTDLQSVFLRLEELVLANSGEDEFEEIFKLLVAKLFDEKKGGERQFRFHSSEETTFKEISKLLGGAEREWPGILEDCLPKLTPNHLAVCVEAIAALELSGSGFEALDNFFEFLVAKQAKGAKGQYFTPRYVIEFCVRAIRPKINETVLDPACGSGGFLFQTLNFIREEEKLADGALKTYCDSNLWGFDIDPRAVRVAKALMVMAGDGRSNILRLNSLLKPEINGLFPINIGQSGNEGPSLTVEDVCRTRMRNHKGFDVILTNPPFAGEVRERSFLDSYETGRGKAKVERDVLFIERCVELLKPGGRMAIILPHNKLSAGSCEPLRKWLLNEARITSVVGLGRNTFLPHTHQKASVVFAYKRLPNEKRRSDEKILFAVSERDGKDSKGRLNIVSSEKAEKPLWTRVDHDLDSVLEELDKHLLTIK